jgi:hypothetical protein
VLLQDEFPNNTACTGFMVFNNDICSKEFLGLIVNNILLFKSHTGTDQELINYLISSNMIPSSHYEYLDKNLFLNGMCFYDSRSIQDSVIVHGNCIIGINNKINRFKKYGLWYI